jgi:hypothetical protein
VRHLVDTSVRPSSRIYYTFARNAVWVALRNYRAPEAASSIIRDLALMGFASARAGELGAYRRGILDAVRGARAAVATRHVLSRETRARLAEIRRLKPGVLARVRRHLKEQLI